MKDIATLQAEFIEKVKKACTFAQVKEQKIKETNAFLYIASKNSK